MPGKCPYCDQLLGQSIIVEPVNAIDNVGTTWKSATFICPHCKKVVGVTFDHELQTNQIIDIVLNSLGTPRKQ